MRKLLDRSTGEILVLVIAFTICGGVGVAGLAAIVFLFIYPEADITNIYRLIASVVNTLIGLLAGFLAGSTTVNTRPKKSEDDVPPPDI
jgi:hypothetical protein